MKFFWPLYLLSFVVGTAGVYVAAPYARPYVADLFGHDTAEQPSAPLQTSTGEAALLKTAARLQTATPSDGPASAGVPPASARPKETEEDDAPPALHGVYLASRGDRPGWGITNQRTPFYKLDGSRVGNVPGGVLFDCSQVHKSSKGLMIECSFIQNGTNSGPFLVSRKEVLLYTASYTNLSSRQCEALQSYYQLNSKIGMRKTELMQASASKNPYFSAANAAYRAFNAHTEKAKELLAKRDLATGPEKSQLEDQLRAMKNAETRLRTELTAANEKFRVWKEQHAQEMAKPENDAEIQKWTQEMSSLRKLVPGLAM
jgi:hypothetical protein